MAENEKNLEEKVVELQKKLDLMESKRHADFIFLRIDYRNFRDN